MKKIRSVEVAQRFFIYDKFREKGNKCFGKGNYEEAIGLFEHVLFFKKIKTDILFEGFKLL